MLHAYRMRSLFGESRIVDDPCLNRSVPCHGRQHHLAHLDQHLLIRPVRDADKMQQRLVLRCRPRRSRPGGHRFHTLALARQYQTRAIVAQRANPIRVPEHARKPRYICRKSNFACPFASRIHVSTSDPNPESSQIVDSRNLSVRPSDSVRLAERVTRLLISVSGGLRFANPPYDLNSTPPLPLHTARSASASSPALRPRSA